MVGLAWTNCRRKRKPVCVRVCYGGMRHEAEKQRRSRMFSFSSLQTPCDRVEK